MRDVERGADGQGHAKQQPHQRGFQAANDQRDDVVFVNLTDRLPDKNRLVVTRPLVRQKQISPLRGIDRRVLVLADLLGNFRVRLFFRLHQQ